MAEGSGPCCLMDGQKKGDGACRGAALTFAPSFATRAHTTKHKSKDGPSDYGNEQTAAREAYTDTERVKRDRGEGVSKTCVRYALAMRTPSDRSVGSSAHVSCAHLAS